MLSLGITHKPVLKSALRNSVRNSDISNLAAPFATKLDLTKFKNPEDSGGQIFRKARQTQ
jgi:hypothetical protein